MTWDEGHVRILVEQITQAALGLSRAAVIMDRIKNAILITGAMCSAFSMVVPIPSAFGDCESPTCNTMLIMGVFSSFISTVLTLLEGKINPAQSAASLHMSAQQLMQLGRHMDVELHREKDSREPYGTFLDKISNKYDDIMQSLESVPQLCMRHQDIVNLTLLRRYSVDAPEGLKKSSNAISGPP